MLKRFRLICALLFSFSIFLPAPLSRHFVCSLNVSNIKNDSAFRLSIHEDQTWMPILFNHTLNYIIPRRRLLNDINPDINNSSNIENSTILDGSIRSNTFIDPSKDNDSSVIETTWTIDPFPPLSTISINIESVSSSSEAEEDVTHIRRKRDALMDQNHLEYKEEKERNEKIDRKRSPAAEKSEKLSSTNERDEVSNVQNSEDGELDDYNALDEKSSADAEESNENEENLEEEDSQEDAASQSNDAKIKRESSDYEYVNDQENSLGDANGKKVAGDVRVKRDEAESVKRINDNVQLEDNSANEGKINELRNLEESSKEEESLGKIAATENQHSKVASAENQDTKVAAAETQDINVAAAENQDTKDAVAENRDSKDKESDLKRDTSKNKGDSVKCSKGAVLSASNGKAVSSETDETVVDTKSKKEERGTRTAPETNDNYEKRVEEQIKRKIDSIKEEIKREIERKRRDREIQKNNAKFDELQSRESDQDEEESLEDGQSLEEELPSKRSPENSKETMRGRRKRQSNENELTIQQLEEIEGVDNLKDEDYRLADLTHESIKKRFAPVYEEASSELEERKKMSLNKALIKKRENVRQMFVVNKDDKQRRKKRGEVRKARETREARVTRGAKRTRGAKEDRDVKIQGKNKKRKVPNRRQVLVPEQARVKIEEELPRDLILDPRLRRSLALNKVKQVRAKRESRRLEGGMDVLEYRPENIEDEENDEGNEFGDDGFDDRTSNLRDQRANSLADQRLQEEQEEENDQPLNFLFSGNHN